MPFLFPIRVYIEDTDAGGIVYYVNYFKYMERARTELMRSLGYDKAAVIDQNCMFVVHSAEAQYRQPARLDDELQVSANVVKVGKATIYFEQMIYRDDQLLCRGDIKVACVDRDSVQPVKMPSSMFTRLHELVAQQQ